MTLDDVKEKFKNEYLRTWLELVDEHQEELYFRTRGGAQFKASAEDLKSYLEFANRQSSFESKPFETCLSSPTHYEQLVTNANHFSSFLSFRRGEKIQFGDPATDPITVEIGEASSDFKNHFRFHEYFVMRTLDRLRLYPVRENQTLSDLLYAPLTVKVLGLNEISSDAAAKKALELIEGCLFNLAYLKGTALVLEEELPKRQALGDNFQFEENDFGKELPLPRAKVNKDVARFYQRGMAVEDPVNQFLSFYQVLEYFFLTVSDEELYRKLASLVNDPLFSAKPKHLDKVIQVTLNHKRESDETEMLRLVISKHVDESELIAFIGAYEDHLGDKWYTKKRKLFGEENEIRVASGHVLGNVAKRVKLVRNALVHSSDRYNRQENFVPTRAAEMEIRKEVPLVKYLAEKVIIASGG
jgi:hypothetical protein